MSLPSASIEKKKEFENPNSCSSSNIWPKPNPNSKGTIRPKSNIE